MSGDETLVVAVGTMDIFNRYPSTVKVVTQIVVPGRGLDKMICSGLLVSDRVVLTAGHCVCRPRKTDRKGEAIIDRHSVCAKTADVSLLLYKPRRDLQGEVEALGDVEAEWDGAYVGVVETHEEFKIVYDRTAKRIGGTPRIVRDTKESRADIAIITLRESLMGKPGYAGHAGEALPRENEGMELHLGDEVVVVGVGSDGVNSIPGKHRFYGSNNIVSMKSDGSAFIIGQQSSIERTYEGERPSQARRVASYVLPGDSGGPCYLERTGKVVGIAKSNIDGDFILSSYTNLLPYLSWVRAKIAQSREID